MLLHPTSRRHNSWRYSNSDQKSNSLPEKYEKSFIQATSINIVVSALYCPPRHSISKEQLSSFFETLGPKFLAGGDFNAKHTNWGSRLITPKGRSLFKSLTLNGYNTLTTRKPTYWPTDSNKCPDLLDFFISKGL